MKSKSTKSNSVKNFEQQAARARKRIEQLVDSGYEFQGVTSPVVDSFHSSPSSPSPVRSSMGGPLANDGSFLFSSAIVNPIVVKDVGLGLGYIPWGRQNSNNLPNEIYRLAGALPYTASALHYLVDLTSGLGPRLMYRTTRYSNKTVSEICVPYEYGGDLLRNLILEVREKIALRDASSGTPSDSTTVPSAFPEGSFSVFPPPSEAASPSSHRGKPKSAVSEPEPEPAPAPVNTDTIGTLEDELDRLIRDYKAWETTEHRRRKFETDNNLSLHYLQCCHDDAHLDIYFPLIGVSQGVKGQPWKPEIVRLDFRPAICCRYEKMDDYFRINNVYYSERWRDESRADLNIASSEIVAYPALMPNSRIPDLHRYIQQHQNTPVSQRANWFCCPSYYPSGSKAYYPQPSWWSIFSSLVYNYASTLVADKYIAQANSTMWGKLIYINLQYLHSLYDQMGADTPEKQEKIKNGIVSSINEFLRNRANNGKTCTLEEMIGPDGKSIIRSVELVDVPAPSSTSATKDELEEISSIIFFALGIHPALIGAVPGKQTSGGTFQRELHLLKQQQVSPRQRMYLSLLNDIARFNQWDPHAEYVIVQQVLTTLDRNYNGIEETVSR